MRSVADCVTSELDREFAATRAATSNPFAATAPQSLGGSLPASGFGRIEPAELMILASNVLAEAGVTGHRFLAAQERTGLFENFDVAWVGPGSRAGGLSGFAFGRADDLRSVVDTAGRDIAASDARACTGKFGSLPTQPGLEDGAYRLELQTACDGSDGRWTVSYSFFGMPDGRLYRFTFIEGLEDAAPPAAGAEAGVSPAILASAATRVISAEP